MFRVLAASGGLFLAGEDRAPIAAQALSQSPLVPSRQQGPPVVAGGSNLAPQPLLPSAAGLAAGGPDPLLRDCSNSVESCVHLLVCSSRTVGGCSLTVV